MKEFRTKGVFPQILNSIDIRVFGTVFKSFLRTVGNLPRLLFVEVYDHLIINSVLNKYLKIILLMGRLQNIRASSAHFTAATLEVRTT
jgi:hypothetical protein